MVTATQEQSKTIRPGYKLTDVGEIPKDWDIVPLAGLCRSICDGTHFTPKYVDHGIPFYSVENLTSDDFTNTKFISQAEHESLIKRCKPERGDILMTRITAGVLGDTRILDWDVNASIYVSLALLKPNGRVLPEYLYHYSRSSAFVRDVERRALVNATPKKINLQDIGAIPIPAPRLIEEQRAIAADLSDVDALLSWLDRLIAKKRDLKTAAMQQLLTGGHRLPGFSGMWAAKALGELATVQKGSQLNTSELNEHGTFAHLNGGISPSGFTDKSNVPGDTIAISEGGNSCGYVQFMSQPFWCGGHCYAVIPNSVDKRFLYHALKGAEPSLMGLRVGSGLPNVQKAALLAFKLRCPATKEEQSAIAAVLSDMEADILMLQARRDKTQALKQGMMQQLLTGNIRLI